MMKIYKSIQILTTVKEWEKSKRPFLLEARKQLEKGAHEVRVIGAGHTLAFFPDLKSAVTAIYEDQKTTKSARTVLNAIFAGITDTPGAEAPKDSTKH